MKLWDHLDSVVADDSVTPRPHGAHRAAAQQGALRDEERGTGDPSLLPHAPVARARVAVKSAPRKAGGKRRRTRKETPSQQYRAQERKQSIRRDPGPPLDIGALRPPRIEQGRRRGRRRTIAIVRHGCVTSPGQGSHTGHRR
jgi:hypothetical protein